MGLILSCEFLSSALLLQQMDKEGERKYSGLVPSEVSTFVSLPTLCCCLLDSLDNLFLHLPHPREALT